MSEPARGGLPDSRVIIFAGPAGEAMADALEASIIGVAPVTVERNPDSVPAVWTERVLIFAPLTDDLPDDGRAELIARADALDFEVCGLVPDLKAFDFGALPAGLAPLLARNALGFDDPGRIEYTVRFGLGLEAPAGRQVFLSYRRADAQDACDAIRGHLLDAGYAVFTDLSRLTGGQRVQAEIERAIRDSDLVLLLESPDVKASPWVEDETIMAQDWRTPVARVRLPGGQAFDHTRGPVFEWRGDDAAGLRALRRFVNRRMGLRHLFHRSVERVIGSVAGDHGARVGGTFYEGRMSWLVRKGSRRVLVEAESQWPSLEQWHGLSRRHGEQFDGEPGASILVTQAPRLTGSLRAAAAWAAGDEPLRLCARAGLQQALTEALATEAEA